MIILGIDYGDKRIGVAICDNSEIIATVLETIQNQDKKHIERIIEIVSENNVEKIIVGLPKNMDGSVGPSAQKALNFARTLRKHLDVKVEMWDERLSTVEAERSMISQDFSRKKRALKIDMAAAQLILQGYLDNQSKG